MAAAWQGHLGVVKVLMAHGAQVGKKKKIRLLLNSGGHDESSGWTFLSPSCWFDMNVMSSQEDISPRLTQILRCVIVCALASFEDILREGLMEMEGHAPVRLRRTFL